MIRRICRLFLATIWLVWPGFAGPPLTIIQDVLYKADGTRFNGTLTISWSSFQSPDNSAIVSQSTTVKVQEGILRVQLVPTTTGTPPSTYTVTYNSDGRVQFQETWSVPASAQPLHVRDVRVAAGSVSGSSTAAADTTSTAIPESSVVGLIADLGARPLKSPSFAPGRTAVVDVNGMVSTAAGNATDCVHVDGSSGPCGSGSTSFMDADSPSGIVDGSNTTFGLSTTPVPAASLAVYRNGMLQKVAQDYTLTGSTVTFVAASTPQPGDTLLASYRTGEADSGTGAASYTAPQILCAGAGTGTSAATPAALGTCSIPAGLLAAGDRVEIRFDYAHQGTGGGVSVEVDWGGTAMVHRDTAAAETLITGRADAAILASGAQLSAESWGATLAFAAGAATAADSYAAGLTVNFMGSVAQSGDTVTLNNFTVVRVP